LKLRIWTALLAIYILWGSTYLAILYAVETIPPFIMAGTRFLAAGILIFLWRSMSGDSLPTVNQWRSTSIIGLLLLLGGNGLVSWAEQYVVSGIAALIIATVPLWMVLIETVRPGGDRLKRIGIVGLCMGFGGIFLLIAPWEKNSGVMGTHLLGAGALLLAAFLWALGSIFARNADLPKSSLMTTAMEMLAGGVGLFIVGTLTGEWYMVNLSNITSRSWFGLVYLIIFGSIIGFSTYSWLLRVAPISLVSTYAYVNPLVAIMLGNIVEQELINARIIISALIIIGTVVLVNSSKEESIYVRVGMK
jgi:drug/metabolite transporter (DMT)-like permease